MKQSLPGIIRVAYVNAHLLPPDITLRALSGAPVGIYTTVQDLCLDGEAVCETEEQFDNNSLVEKAKLTFSTHDNLPVEGQLAFVVTTVNMESYIIGAKEQPYPTVKISRSTGTPSGDPSVRKYEVTFSARKSLVLCAV